MVRPADDSDPWAQARCRTCSPRVGRARSLMTACSGNRRRPRCATALGGRTGFRRSPEKHPAQNPVRPASGTASRTSSRTEARPSEATVEADSGWLFRSWSIRFVGSARLVRAKGDDQRDVQIADAQGQVAQRADRSEIGPMQVIDSEHQRSEAGEVRGEPVSTMRSTTELAHLRSRAPRSVRRDDLRGERPHPAKTFVALFRGQPCDGPARTAAAPHRRLAHASSLSCRGLEAR